MRNRQGDDSGRMIEVVWSVSPNDRFTVSVQFKTTDTQKSTQALTAWLAQEKVLLVSLQSSRKSNSMNSILISIMVMLEDHEQLDRLLVMLSSQSVVDDSWRE